MLATKDTNIGYIDESINKLANLEILVMQNSNVSINMPFNSIPNLTKLKAIEITNFNSMMNDKIPNTLCNLTDIRYFEMNSVSNLDYFPFDCVVSNWDELISLKLDILPSITKMNPDLWLLPNLATVLFENNNFDPSYFQFSTFNGYSDGLVTISVSGNKRICNGSITINDVEYDGFGYLGGTNFTTLETDSNYNSEYVPLLEFIQTFDVCNEPCDQEIWVCYVCAFVSVTLVICFCEFACFVV